MLLSKGAGVDAGEHHLLGSAVGYASGHAEGLFDGGGAGAAAGEGDGTVGAEIVAAILYLEECARAVFTRVL